MRDTTMPGLQIVHTFLYSFDSPGPKCLNKNRNQTELETKT